MRSTRFGLAALLAAGLLAAAGCGGGDEEAATDTETTEQTTTGGTEPGFTLLGSVGPGFEISVTTPAGDEPGTLSAGSWELQVDDKSSAHNFHLTGPGGVDVSTEVGGSGAETFEVELEPGTYSFVCDPHASSMNGTLEVAGS
ncbi:MAG TPA: plastocyanin/azurin family copper-binding protein [Gaiellaceae bacterium]|nr:plastocyanin/azurin family copper-binding protein [Gaiellaceae bacterium]